MWDFSWIYVSCKLSVIHGHILVCLPVGEGTVEQPFLLVWTVFSDASYEWCQLLLVSQEFLHDFSRVQQHKKLGSCCTKRICSWVLIAILDSTGSTFLLTFQSTSQWILGWHQIDTWSTSQSTLDQPLIYSWSMVGPLLTDPYVLTTLNTEWLVLEN